MEAILNEILCILKEMKDKPKEKLTYTLDECAAISGIGKNTLLEETYKDNSTFPYFKVGRKIRVNSQMFREWLKNISESHQELRN